MVLTWPVTRFYASRLAGGAGDPQLTLWSMRWMYDALRSLQNPFFTTRLYHPQGTTLVFHTFDLPSTLLVLPLWSVLPEVAIYNTAVLFAVTLSVYGMFRLVREVTGDPLCALLAGILFAAVPYSSAHIHGQLHLMSMGWLPLYVLHLLRVLSGRGRGRDAALAGLFLALASLASWYDLLFAAVITIPLVVQGAYRHHAAWRPAILSRDVAVLAGTWAVLAGPLLAAMLRAKAREEIIGAHDALVFSADAYSFVIPSAIQTWCSAGTPWLRTWGRQIGEHATYVGFTVLLLALLGAVLDRRGRAFLTIGLLGAVLTLGPFLQWQGAALEWRMPYWYLVHAVPAVAFTGVPVRFGYVMYFGLIVAAGLGLARVRARIADARVSAVLVVAIAALALYEYWPCPVPTSACPTPPLLREWAKDPGAWAVLDTTEGWRRMWHATIHRKAIVGAYLGRAPKRLEDWMLTQPVIRAIAWPDASLPLARVDPGVDFTWRYPRDDGTLVGDRFSVQWTGSLLAPADGDYRFWLSTTVGARLQIGGRRVAGRMARYGDDGAPHEESGSIHLAAGGHPVVLAAMELDRAAEIHLSWAPPGGERGIVPAEVLRAADGTAGLDGDYTQHVPPLSGLGRVAGRDALRRLAIRYVITADMDNACVERELDLPEVYRGESVRIYEVPGGT